MFIVTKVGQISVKLVLVGDASVGKSCLPETYVRGVFPEGRPFTWIDPYACHVEVGHKSYSVWFHDTAGKKDYDALRPLSYPGADIFLVCYDIASPSSFRNVYSKWVPEIRRHCPTTPFLLVATKIDLRGDESVEEKHGQQGLGIISTSEGKAMAVHLGAAKYIECSAKTQYQLQHLLQEACILADGGSVIKVEEKKSNKCCVIL